MFSSIRIKLTATYLILIVAVMVLTSLFLLQLLERYYMAYHLESLRRAAGLAGRFLSGYINDSPNVVIISNLATDYSLQIGARVLVTDHRQRVLGDSERVDGLTGLVLDREEVEVALSGGLGRSIQYSRLTHQWVMQVSVPIYDENQQILGAVFVASSLNQVDEVLAEIRRYLMFVTAAALVLAAILGNFFASRITEPIKLLTAATEKMAGGDFAQRVAVGSRDELGKLAVQFNHMANQVQEMTRQLKEFVSNASHELRTPLTSLNILVKSWRAYPLEPEEQKEFLEDIDNEISRMIHLVESLLDLTRLDRLSADDTLVIADIVPTVINTLDILEKRAQEKQIRLEYDLPLQAPPILVVLHQIKQVVFNLVDNALKYTPAGGRILVALKEEAGRLVLTVADTGMGIAPEHRQKVFERFYRVDTARAREQGGTGLGLAIVKEIIARHGGSIWIEDNENGEGTKFIITLPCSDFFAEDINKI